MLPDNKNLIVRTADENDFQEFIGLMNLQYQRKKSKDYYFWMYVNNHLPTKLFTVCYENKPIAFYGSQVYKLKNGLYCSQSVDIITDQKFRGQGLFKLLENEAFKFSCSFNSIAMTVLPNKSGMVAHEKLDGWKTISKIDTLIFDCKNKIPEKIDLSSCKPTDIPFVFSRDQSYNYWRYDKNPVYEYHKISLSDNGYAVVKRFYDKETNLVYGDIVDFSVDLNDVGLIFELFKKAFAFLKNKKVNYISTWALRHEALYRILTMVGFSPLQQERYFCVRALGESHKDITKIENWHLVQSNAEIY